MSQTTFQNKVCTRTLSNGTITIDPSWGVKAVAVLNLRTSTTNGTINGGSTMGSLASQAIDILPGGSRCITAIDGTLTDIVITSSAVTCTLEIIFIF